MRGAECDPSKSSSGPSRRFRKCAPAPASRPRQSPAQELPPAAHHPRRDKLPPSWWRESAPRRSPPQWPNHAIAINRLSAQYSPRRHRRCTQARLRLVHPRIAVRSTHTFAFQIILNRRAQRPARSRAIACQSNRPRPKPRTHRNMQRESPRSRNCPSRRNKSIHRRHRENRSSSEIDFSARKLNSVSLRSQRHRCPFHIHRDRAVSGRQAPASDPDSLPPWNSPAFPSRARIRARTVGTIHNHARLHNVRNFQRRIQRSRKSHRDHFRRPRLLNHGFGSPPSMLRANRRCKRRRTLPAAESPVSKNGYLRPS